MSRFSRLTRSSNPVMNESVLAKSRAAQYAGDEDLMTVQGAINKTFILFGVLMLTAGYNFYAQNSLLTIGGAIAGLIVVFIAVFKKEKSNILAPIYAALEGLFVGGISAMFAAGMSGIILQAVSLTLMVFFMMLFIYKSNIIPVTNKLRTGIVMATGSIFLVYMLSWILGMFGINIPFLHEGGTVGIIISLVIIGVAALNLLLDFDMFEKGEEYGAPSYMEWFAGMALLITLVWIYIEILRLLAILSSSD
jgi:uncharacterized YccA/Bax inhibitor family protein